ncbi:hypothetical protein NEOLI_005194 [Neolecta irregularis DAH-3]|uniref:Uncharacterized protein n=1 Tax=Neolecta irregularis (strain DAH-3) TaxID=1198029 RepID=A0A1U7LQS2_NEOID|nr:hypothetical protein NEOLI_005194 [Neolecta irregularis DAH-3]|eukprot:OLL24902.1 hypothetical protein NEOLI_005194 [Neolecta irregularis DAH-3]
MKFIAATALFAFAVAAIVAPPCFMPAVTKVAKELKLPVDASILCRNDEFVHKFTIALKEDCPARDYPLAIETAKELCKDEGVDIYPKNG